MDKVIIAENLSLSYKEFETIISKAVFPSMREALCLSQEPAEAANQPFLNRSTVPLSPEQEDLWWVV